MNKKKLSFLLLFIIFAFVGIQAQVVLSTYFDIGETNVSEGVYVKNLYEVDYKYKQYHFAGGFQLDLKSNNPNVFSGFYTEAASDFKIKEFPLSIHGYFLFTRYSDLLHQTDWGIYADTKNCKHFLFKLGLNFKTYAINNSVATQNNIDKQDQKLHENFNLIYDIAYYLKPHANDWNIGLSLTNTDYYLINQSTNPMFNLQANYKIKPQWTLYFDAWYKPAGIFNISVNYFGYFFRGGVIWQI